MNLDKIKKLPKNFAGNTDAAHPRVEADFKAGYDRYLNLVDQNSFLRKLCLGSFVVAAIAIGAFVYQSLQSEYIPYVVTVNEAGRVTSSEVITKNANGDIVTAGQIEYFLTNFVERLRTIHKDKTYYKQELDKLYDLMNRNTFNKIQEYINNDEKVQFVLTNNGTTDIVIKSFIKIDNERFQITWTEKSYASSGNSVAEQTYTSILLLGYKKVDSEKMVRTNPLGMIVRDIEIKAVNGTVK